MTTTVAGVQCPKCGSSELYDNRKENDARLASGEKLRPDWKCKDKACDGVIWRPKNGTKAAPAPAAKQAYSAGPHIPAIDGEHPALPHEKLDQLFAVYDVCWSHAMTVAKQMDKAEVGSTPESVAAIAATLFIAATDRGIVL